MWLRGTLPHWVSRKPQPQGTQGGVLFLQEFAILRIPMVDRSIILCISPQTCTIFYPQDPRQTTPHQGRERACQHASMHIYPSIFLSSYLSLHLSLSLCLCCEVAKRRSGEADETSRSLEPWRFSGWWNAKASSLWRCKSLGIYRAPVHAENYVWVVMLAYVPSKTFHMARADVYRS